MDDQVTAVVTEVREGIANTDMLITQLLCVSQLVRIEPNPTLVDAFLRRGLELFLALEHAGRWHDLIAQVTGYTALADELRERRPDVAEAIGKALSDFCTPSRLLALADLHDRDDQGRAIVESITRALGPALVPGFVALIDRTAHQVKARAFTPLMCELAPVVAEALLAELDSCGVTAARVIVKVLGYAGAGHEPAVAGLAQHNDVQVAREALARSRAWAPRPPPRTSPGRFATAAPTVAPPLKTRSGTSRPRRRPPSCVSCCGRASSYEAAATGGATD